MANTVDKVIKVAEGEVGYLEKKSNSSLQSKTANAGSANYTKYTYEMHQIYPSVMDHPAPWCDAFVDWCFQEAYGVSNAKGLLGGNFNDYTVASAQLYKNKKAWYSSPKVGDQIFFKNSQRICHTGLVYKVTATRVYTIEGNTSGASGVIANGGGVCKKSYALNYSQIAGYGRPKYDVVTSSNSSKIEPVKKEEETTTPTKITANIRSIQKWLNKYYNAKLTVDGDYGPKTKAALIKAWQKEAGGLTVDGDFGPKSQAKAKSINIDKGDKGIFVTILQATLFCQGYAPGYIDGDFGTRTKTAVLEVQRKHKLTRDGVVGSKTWTALFD